MQSGANRFCLSLEEVVVLAEATGRDVANCVDTKKKIPNFRRMYLYIVCRFMLSTTFVQAFVLCLQDQNKTEPKPFVKVMALLLPDSAATSQSSLIRTLPSLPD